MATITTNGFSLTKWEATDKFDYTQLAANWQQIADHDHATKGAKITTSAIADITTGSETTTGVTNSKIANSAITTAKIADSTGSTDGITTSKIANNAVTSDKVDSTVIATYQASTLAVPTGVENKRFWTTTTSLDNTTSASPSSFATSWAFKYKTADSKWYFIDGTPLTIMQFDAITVNTSSYASVTGTTLTLPYFGAYILSFSAEVNVAATSTTGNTFKINLSPSSGITTYEATVATGAAVSVAQSRHVSQSRIVNVTSSSNNIYNLYAYSTGTTTPKLDNICITATPIYITALVS